MMVLVLVGACLSRSVDKVDENWSARSEAVEAGLV